MRLKKFRIQNYKSIVDSGECVLSDAFTVLIGKNESGKTSVLEALRDFDRDNSISKQAVPISAAGQSPLVELHLTVTDGDLNAAVEASGAEISGEQRAKILREGIVFTKMFPGHYEIQGWAADEIFSTTPAPEDRLQTSHAYIKAKQERLSEILKGIPLPDLKFGESPAVLEEMVKDLRSLVKSSLNFIKEEEFKVEAVELLHEISRSMSAGEGQAAVLTPRDKFIRAMVRRLPRFVFFSDFKDILPFEIPVEAVKSNQTVQDFARIADLDLDAVLKTDDLQKRINLLSRASAVISGDFLKHWQQNRIELMVRPEGNMLLFGVKEAGSTDIYKMEQRSKGFQWFLSFYLRLNRYKNDSAVILIDEPGMNLHPAAQKDILKVLRETASETAQIVFSTHSPSLLEPQRLNHIRFLVKSAETGSVIIADESGIDEETLMPLTAARSTQLYNDLYHKINASAEEPAAVEIQEIAETPAAEIPAAEAPAAEISPAQEVPAPGNPLPEPAAVRVEPPVTRRSFFNLFK